MAASAARAQSRYCFSPNSFSLPSPTRSTLSAATPATRYSSRVLPILPSMSPDRRSSRIWPCAALSSTSAAPDNFRDSNTPAATHATGCFSGVANFVLNSTRPRLGERTRIIPGLLRRSQKQHGVFRLTIRLLDCLRSVHKVIFQRALLREFGNLALAVFATLFAITLTTQLIRLLGQAAIGQVLSAGVVALVAVLSLFLSPWALGKAEEYRPQMDLRDEVSRVAQGVFREAGSADRVF